jgi:putative transposase
MVRLSFKRHRFPPDVIRHAVWLYFRFTLSFRVVEELLAQRGISVSYETVADRTYKRPYVGSGTGRGELQSGG